MKKIATVVFSILAVLITAACFGFTAARYETAVTVESKIDHAKTACTLSLYRPDWVLGYDASDGTFAVQTEEAVFGMIWFSVTNKREVSVNGTNKEFINDIETDYFFRIVPSVAGATMPIKYTAVYKYDRDPNDCDPDDSDPHYVPCTREEAGYGAFTLPSSVESVAYYAVRVEFKDDGNAERSWSMKMQTVTERADGSLKVIGESDFIIKKSLAADEILVTFGYYDKTVTDEHGTFEFIDSRQLVLKKGSAISKANLAKLGVTLPDGYAFDSAQSFELTGKWDYSASLTVPADTTLSSAYVTLLLYPAQGITLTAEFFDANKTNADGSLVRLDSQTLKVEKGATVSAAKLGDLGITVPDGYEFDAVQCSTLSGTWDYFDSITIPEDTELTSLYMAIRVRPVETGGQKTVGVTVEFADGSGKSPVFSSVTSDEDGKFVLDLATLNGWAGGEYISYTVYIVNTWNTYGAVGNVNSGASVTVEYSKEYTDGGNAFSLSSGMKLVVKAWE